jgi:hypothetical protein
MQAEMSRLDHDVAVILDGVADRIRRGGAAPVIDVDGSGPALEQSFGPDADAPRAAIPAGSLRLYRELAAAVNRVADDSRSVDAVTFRRCLGEVGRRASRKAPVPVPGKCPRRLIS